MKRGRNNGCRGKVHGHVAQWPGRARSAGFSLIELLVVVVIVLILATLYWGGNSGNRQKKLLGSCAEDLQKVYIALSIYATEHSGKFPDAPGAKTSEEVLNLLVPKYTSDTESFICPGSHDSVTLGADNKLQGSVSYAVYMGRATNSEPEALMSDRQIDSRAKNKGQVTFSLEGKPPGNNHQGLGGNFLFTDGHVEATGPRLAFPVELAPGVTLLNPKGE